MNAEQLISLADVLRSRALHAGVDVNASNYLVHATLIRALRERPLNEIAPEALTSAFERTAPRLS
jgi:2'-5' RNA ligase